MHARHERNWSWMLGALACALLVLEQVLVPMHLALNDHVAVAGPGRHLHSRADVALHVAAHGTHGASHHSGLEVHDHGPVDRGVDRGDDAGSDADDAPHPAEDHLDQLAKPFVLPGGIVCLLAPVGGGTWEPSFDHPAVAAPGPRTHAVRPPPPGTRRDSRAPPARI